MPVCCWLATRDVYECSFWKTRKMMQIRHAEFQYLHMCNTSSFFIIIFGRSRSIVLLTNLNLLSLFSSIFPFLFQFHNLYSLFLTLSTSNFIAHHTESDFFTKPVKPTLKAIDDGRPNHLLWQTSFNDHWIILLLSVEYLVVLIYYLLSSLSG